MLTKDDLAAIDNLIKKGNNSVKKDLKKYIKDELKKVVNFFDRDYLKLKKRVDKIETHLELPPIQ